MLDSALSSIPAHLRSPIIDFYVGILDDYSRSDFEGVGTKSGKICETVYCILVGLVFGTFPSELEKPKNFVDSCRDLENKSLSTISRSHRIQIPKVLIAIYEMRNNRSIGHVHSEISPNYMDAEFFVRSVKWIVAELVRTLAGVGTDKAAELVDSITMINTPMVWNVNGQKRVLDPTMSYPNRVLVLIYGSTEPLSTKQVFVWTKHSNSSSFKSKILADLDRKGFVEFDQHKDSIMISPTGRKHVEDNKLLLKA